MNDPSSAANFSEVVIRHIRLKWRVCFEEKKIFGVAAYEAEFLSDSNKIILDGRDLNIQNVDSENDCTFTTEDNGIFGQRIVIKFEPLFTAGEKIHFSIRYSTSDKAQALQFVDAKLTSDKNAPFLYSQCQTIHARSILPCMDTPNVKQTYNAEVTVPAGVVCLMSALSLGSVPGEHSDLLTFKFSQYVPIPSYLLAIVVGALERREISSRCAVWAEPSKVDAARWEFENTEQMLATAEELISEYVWKRYDMVLLPPFFSYGGMENPMLTFLTPTLLVGDRSMCDVIAHEITHSWFGNLVTNANWEYFWLNEGFTKFVENKIIGRLYGESYRQFQSLCDWENDLKFTVYDTYSPSDEHTKLIPNLTGRNPEEFCSLIPYMKGSAFLLLLEQKLGGPEVFEQFLRAYVKKFAPKSIGIDNFLSFLWEYFVDKKEVLNKIAIDKWLYEPGMPPDTPIFDRTLASKCYDLAAKWTEGTIEAIQIFDSREFLEMTSLEQLNFFNILDQQGSAFLLLLEQKLGGPEKEHRLSPEKIQLMDEKYEMGSVKNCNVKCKWILLALRCGYRPIVAIALKFVTDFGRLKYLIPIYRRLFQDESTKEAALKTLEKNAEFMHPISYNKVKSSIKPNT